MNCKCWVFTDDSQISDSGNTDEEIKGTEKPLEEASPVKSESASNEQISNAETDAHEEIKVSYAKYLLFPVLASC